MWKAKYVRQGEECWRTVYADTLNQATKMAKRFTPKGFTFSTVTQSDERFA